ncbi:MAG TPA: sigma-70 family RNA polymerase sigma factor [Acidimicrobiales bacterium]|jgi:RNA polymerase sigma-70 factor (ECF subfamily)
MRRDRFAGQFRTVLVAARQGEPWAFERIFVALSPVVVGYLRLQGSREPDDLTSEVFLGVHRNLSSFEGDESEFRSWVFTIAHRRLLDERRRGSRRPPPEPLPVDLDPAAPDDVEDTVAESLSIERVRALCERLAPDQRDVLLLRLLGRLTVDEVAATLHKTPGAVKALQRRGFSAVGRLLDSEGVPL